MITYEFKSIDEFVSYLDTQAKEARQLMTREHKRSHVYARLESSAHSFERVASVVRASNLVVVTDYMRAAMSKAVG